ncbi:MAG: sulfotransferase domain-containing protein [Planctomycetes bacterium]|nr:sulfotransferase domain-containing protein [Planctomycetota bacterium]
MIEKYAKYDQSPSAFPDFYVVGAGRAGTTSVHHYLSQHPKIFVPESKSSSFFYASDLSGSPLIKEGASIPEWFVQDEKNYINLYSSAPTNSIRGDVSPVYLASTRVASRISATRPDAKIVVFLRNPVDRVYSRFTGRRRDGLEKIPTFEELVEREINTDLVRDDAHASYLASGMIAHQLRTYFDAFPRENIQIHFYEDFASDTQGIMASTCKFLGVDDEFQFDVRQIHNRSGGRIRNPAVGGLWASSLPVRKVLRPFLPQSLRDGLFHKATSKTKPIPIRPATRFRLIEIYREDVRVLEGMTNRDLSAWLRSPTL